MLTQPIYHSFQRWLTLKTHRITALPIVILMPHSACNCKCVMCDIWKDNHNLKQLTEEDISGLLVSLKKWGTRQVLMSGGEALLNKNFFRFCEMLRKQGISITLLSTGLSLKRNAEKISGMVKDVIVSIDGDEETHDQIRNIPSAFQKLKEGIMSLRFFDPYYRVTGRSVIHRLNFRKWPSIVESAMAIGLNQISFLPADVSSHAFNREQAWDIPRQQELSLSLDDLEEMKEIIDQLISKYKGAFETGFIAESPEKIRKIYSYYAAFHGLNPFPFKKCNAPWVSTVIEADGTVRPCFFHEAVGNIHDQPLHEILNSERAIAFRRSLDMDNNSTCVKCVCYLNLSPATNPS